MRIKVGLWFLLTLPRPGVDLNYHMRTLKTHFFFNSVLKYPYLTHHRLMRIDDSISARRLNCLSKLQDSIVVAVVKFISPSI